MLGHLLVLPRKIEVEDPAELDEKRKQLEAASARHEEFWVNRLASLEPVSVPLKRKEISGESAEKSGLASVGISRALASGFGKDATPEEVFLAALCVWLVRTTGMQSFNLSFADSALGEKPASLATQFASAVPLQLEIDLKGTFAEALGETRAELAKLRARGTYSLDLPLRNPALSTFPASR